MKVKQAQSANLPTNYDPRTGIHTTTLPNGLQIIIKERHHAPVVCLMMWYRVGSADETIGKTGLAHLLEHMMFKGTDRYAKGEIDLITQQYGGSNNAYTFTDFTAYHFNFAADRWEIGLAIEANRMRNCRFDPKEFQAEKQVVLDELNHDLDNPFGLLDREVTSMAFQIHPYRHAIIGRKEDVQGLTIEDLEDFYQRFYTPDNAILVMVGDFNSQEALAKAEQYFASIEPGGVSPRPQLNEPPQLGERRLTFYQNSHIARLQCAYHTCCLQSPDNVVLDVIDALLDGGKASRLHYRLVEQEKLMLSIDTINDTRKYAGLFWIFGELYPGIAPAQVEPIIMAEIESLAKKPIRQYELQKAKNQVMAHFVFNQETAFRYAEHLGVLAVSADHSLLADFPERLEKVTVEDIQSVAARYFQPSNRTVGWSLPRQPVKTFGRRKPTRGKAGRLKPLRRKLGPVVFHEGPGFARKGSALDVQQHTLSNGLSLFVLENHSLPVVSIVAEVQCGRLCEPPEKAGLAYLFGKLLEEGTRKHTALELAQSIEYLGAKMSTGSTGVACKVLARDLPMVLELIAELLIQPVFPASALAKERQKVLAEILRLQDDAQWIAKQAFYQLVYGRHPYGRPLLGTPPTIKKIKRRDILAFHRRYFVPNNTRLVIVGDVAPARVQQLVQRHFKAWQPHSLKFPSIPVIRRQRRPKQLMIPMDREQLNIYLGHLGVRRTNPDYETLMIMDHILGIGEGFTDRLSKTLRDEQGLAYSVWALSTANAGLEPGLFSAYIGTDPKYLRQAVAGLHREIQRFREQGATAEELHNAKAFLSGNFVFAFETNSQLALHILATQRYHLGFDYITRFLKRVQETTLADIHRVARKYLHPEAASLVVVGKDLPTTLPNPN